MCGFAAVVDGVRYEGAVKPRDEAFAAYDDAMAAGHGAFLLDEERPDVFTASIGNLAPGAEAQIELTYVTELACEDDSIRFTLPTTVSPRYAPRRITAGSDVRRPTSSIPSPRRGAAWPVIHRARGHARAYPSHRIAVPPDFIDFDGDRATVTLAQAHVALDRDLRFITPRRQVRRKSLERTKSGRSRWP